MECCAGSSGLPMLTAWLLYPRRPLGIHHVKIDVVIEKDMFQLQNIGMLEGFDACFFCLGASSVGMTETEYRHLTYDLTLAVACQLLPRNPRIIFELISGGRADVDAKQMWSRVKAETENAVLNMGFFDAYALRPGYIQPMRGASSRYRIRAGFMLCWLESTPFSKGRLIAP